MQAKKIIETQKNKNTQNLRKNGNKFQNKADDDSLEEFMLRNDQKLSLNLKK